MAKPVRKTRLKTLKILAGVLGICVMLTPSQVTRYHMAEIRDLNSKLEAEIASAASKASELPTK